MAGKVARRIEPTFDKPRRAGLSVSDDDRVLPARKPAGARRQEGQGTPRAAESGPGRAGQG